MSENLPDGAPHLLGYDAYGRPVYAQQPAPQAPQPGMTQPVPQVEGAVSPAPTPAVPMPATPNPAVRLAGAPAAFAPAAQPGIAPGAQSFATAGVPGVIPAAAPAVAPAGYQQPAYQVPGQQPVAPLSAAPMAPQAQSPLGISLSKIGKPASLQTIGLVLAVVAGVGFGCGLLTFLSNLMANSGFDIGKLLPFSIVSAGLWLGGGLKVGVSAMGFSGNAVTVSIVPVLPFAFIGIFVALFVRKRRVQDEVDAYLPGTVLRSIIEAIFPALVLGILTGVVRLTENGYGASGWVGTNGAAVAAWVWFVVALAMLVGRLGSQLTAWIPVGVRGVFSEFGSVAWAFMIVIMPVTVIGLVIFAAINDGLAAIPLIIPAAGNLALYFLNFGLLGTLTVRADISDLGDFLGVDIPVPAYQEEYIWEFAGYWSILVLVTIVVFIVVAALRVGVHRPRLAGAYLGRTWQLGVSGAIVALLLFTVVMPVHVSSGLVGSGSVAPSGITFLTFTLVAFLISVLAEYLPTWAYHNAGSLLRAIGGEQATKNWIAGVGSPVAVPAQAPVPQTAAYPQGYPMTAQPVAPVAQRPVAQAPAAGFPTQPIPPIQETAPVGMPPIPTAPAAEAAPLEHPALSKQQSGERPPAEQA